MILGNALSAVVSLVLEAELPLAVRSAAAKAQLLEDCSAALLVRVLGMRLHRTRRRGAITMSHQRAISLPVGELGGDSEPKIFRQLPNILDSRRTADKGGDGSTRNAGDGNTHNASDGTGGSSDSDASVPTRHTTRRLEN